MTTWIDAWSDFISQPFGLVGATCIMAAVTAINSKALAARLAFDTVSGQLIFNGLNLVGGVCLFVNAILRDEIVWFVLEIYFIAIAIKGILQLRNRGDRRDRSGNDKHRANDQHVNDRHRANEPGQSRIGTIN